MDKAQNEMPVRAVPYGHQREAYRFVCGLFGLQGAPVTPEGGDAQHSIRSQGAALLMEM